MYSKFFSFPFSDVFCISLVSSEARRKHVISELDKHKINKFEFVDAVTEKSQIVKDAYQDGVVKLYPPCFRCGQESCECENNVLIATQVATFFSHMKVWRKVAAQKDGMYLIIEDDIKFNWYYKIFRYYLYRKISNFLVNRLDKPLLIRLAWAHNEEHKFKRFKFVSGLVKMSNPMYAINPGMAKALLKEFEVIDTSVDMYVHKQIGPKYANYTLTPPIAHELSYSHGLVESLIRPRAKRIEELTNIKNENRDAAQEELSKYDEYIDRAVNKRLLVIGHPRTGSGYMSELLRAYGLDVGHELMGSDGIVSWMFTVFDLENPYYLNKYAKSRYFAEFENIIMFARDPFSAIPSIIRENNSSEASYNFRAKHILKNFDVNLNDIENEFERAIEAYYLWSMLAIKLNSPELIVKVEEGEVILKKYLQEKDFDIVVDPEALPDKSVNKDKLYKGNLVKKIQLDNSDWLVLGDVWKRKVNELCTLLKYKPIYDQTLSVVIR